MTLIAVVALIVWVPTVIMFFGSGSHLRATAIAVIGAWILLPPFSMEIKGLPDYSKNTASSLGLMLGTLIFCSDRLLRFRLRWFDVPILLYCFSPIPSALQNGLPLYDGYAMAQSTIFMWGAPYFFGRLYLDDAKGLKYFAVAIAIGGLACVLPCIFEMRMSPSLRVMIYGGKLDHIALQPRLGGYRPMLFFATGLELGMWMTAASLAGWWLWWCGAIKRLGSLSFGAVLLPILFVTTIFCRSTGAMTLLGAGIALLWISVRFRTRLLLAAVLLAPPLYVGVRTANLWSGQQAVDLTTSLVDAERAESLAYRFMCENLLMKRALQRPVWGWSGWDRSAVYFNENKPWKKRVATDGVWITALGSGGYVGLVLLYLSIAVPVARFLWRFPPRLWALPEMAAASLASVLLSLYMIDCLMNAFINIIYLTLAGGLNSFDFTQLQAITPYPVGLGGAATRREPLSARHVATTAGIRAIDLAEQGHSRGRVLKAAGQFKEAQSAWRQTLDLLNPLLESHPEQPDLWLRWGDCGNDLAWLWANSPDLNERDPDAAVEMARQIVEKFPDVATYWNTLGAAYYRAGDDRSAVAALNRAMALGGGTAFDDVFMAMAQARLGNQQGARRALALAQFRSERDCPWHPELIILCTEARSVVVDFTEAPTTAVDHQS